MRITNSSGINIICKINDACIHMEPGSNFDCNERFDFIMFAPDEKSYSRLEAEKSRILRVLSFFDDPFKLIKEYHLAINSVFSDVSVCDSQQLNITAETCYVDTDTRTYYEYVKLEADGKRVRPKEVSILNWDKISKDFILNNTRLAKWQSVWDVIIEPIIFEVIGYYAAYCIFYIWFGEKAWSIVLFLLIPNILLELLMLIFKRKKYKIRENKFQKHFSSEVIYDYCYDS